ncbi:hypothetical protein SARC_06259 [Sphaeroforma arctica JP610]|uniref:Uncharacterized protein n=1 Tax=Sphaeroforma arctica JP610 TaxID=667725 RepID=A0A0L0FZM3_9EUKA|nr:hypothetical protein SARC_06259 [Sphaeroforma arctica JP610]KNC81418.1 hypothetical protein SARC_06259 [Sphaeroforma arctica JP610]|eukprot:XP_014155320.1 hypothetical protein SARC_06259 [Sphaeroforma arctica JP610]
MMHTLYKVTTKGDIQEVAKLLDEGRDVNEIFDGGETALHGAAGFGNTQASELLLDRGADPNIRDVVSI